MAYFEVYRDQSAKRQYRWRFFADSGDLVATSGGDGYSAKADCLGGIQALKSYRGEYEPRGGQGQHHWRFLSTNGIDTIAVATNRHLTKKESELEIQTVRAQVPDAEVMEE